MRPDGGVGAIAVSAATPVHERVHIGLNVGAFADTKGTASLRDAQLTVPLFAVAEPDLQIRVIPGVSLPLGSATSGLEYTLLTTGSFDPTLGLDVSAGSSWVVLGAVNARLPLHPGFDRVQQGLYANGSARVARRVGSGAVHLGLSLAGQRSRGLTSPGFVELAPVAGAAIPLGDEWGGTLSIRVPVWAGDTAPPYHGAVRIGITRVLGS